MVLKIPVTPVPKNGDRIGAHGFHYIPEKVEACRKAIRASARSQWKKPPIQVPVKLEITFYLPRPKTVTRDYPSVKPDLDNLAKNCCDALNGLIYQDDCLIVDLILKKRYAPKGSITIKIKEF